jgi:hypothetical protein
MKPSADGSAFFLAGKEGVRSSEDGFGFAFGFTFYELASYRATPHFFDEGDLAQSFLSDLSEFGEFGYGVLLFVALIQQLKRIAFCLSRKNNALDLFRNKEK